MKILSAQQVRQADAYTIAHEPIASIDLMERASQAFAGWFQQQFPLLTCPSIQILCGQGNNGGDGLAVARLLRMAGYEIHVFVIALSPQASSDFTTNLERLRTFADVQIQSVQHADELPVFGEHDILIDAIVGTGLTRPLSGELASIVKYINECGNTVVAIDIPTGVFADSPTTGVAIHASFTATFECPKYAFLFPEHFKYVGEFTVLPIGLHPTFIKEVSTPNCYITRQTVKAFFKTREKFAHKGVYGHALLVAGSYGKMGAAILATKACLRSGAGLVTVHVPTCGYDIMQTAVPEAMVSLDEDDHIFTRVYDLHKYTTIAVGCGLSTKNKTRNALCYILKNMEHPTVLDADALNILGQSPDWLEFIPKNSILTPHAKEFERLFGVTTDSFQRNEIQRQKAKEFGVYIILKGANTCIATPDGTCYFNSTGNPGMGTAGSGDVLTGILAGLLAQHYTPLEACILGVYLHGLAGDIAAVEQSQEALTAGDLIDYLGKVFLALHRANA